MKNIYAVPLVFWICASFFSTSFANEQPNTQEPVNDDSPYLISLYEPTYIMPFSYTSSFNAAAGADTPDNLSLDHIETKFQLSVRVPVWRNFFNFNNSLNLAYTQLSFWQVYNNSPFFRETNYQPEIYFKNVLDVPLFGAWRLNFLNLGFNHDSNGRGGTYERSWNRVYGEMIFSRYNLMFRIRPWYVINNSSLENNRDIANYLGYERVILAYKFNNQTLSLLSYNLEHLTTRPSVQLSWSFPLISKLHGYVQVFDGYGQSLIEYNHHADSISAGISLNDWI